MMNKTRATQDIDKVAGNNMRSLRNNAGLSQADLGTELGVSFQQIQKYERGANRLSLARAVRLADLLKVSVDDLAGRNGARKLAKPLERIDFELMEELSELDDDMKSRAREILRAMNLKATRNKRRKK